MMHSSPLVILDNARDGHMQIFSRPSHIIAAHRASEVPAALNALHDARAAGAYLAGYFSYELGYALEPGLAGLLPRACHTPLLWFGVFDNVQHRRADAADQVLGPPTRVYTSPLDFEWDYDAYRQRFESVIVAIQAGDAYQVNLSMRARFRLAGSPRSLYWRLRAHAHAAHGAFVDDGERQLLSLSPELFFEVHPDARIHMRPMKGTAPRGRTAAADAALSDELRNSRKNRAENLMIVDLIRNDLGRIARTGSVQVPELFTVETYPTVHQMTSSVQAALYPGAPVATLLDALFPCGSVTGAPKISAMKLIGKLETSARGIYCGAIGMFAPDGSAHFNVAIRTATLRDGVGDLGVGGAIVSDSRAHEEYRECLLKARFFEAARDPLSLIETLPRKHGEWPRRERHLHRMQASAQHLGISFDADKALQHILAAAQTETASHCRVRLCLQENGELSAQATALEPSDAPWKYLVWDKRLDSKDPLCRHKTSWRAQFDEALAWARARGADEAILLNERDEVCEASRSNVFIEHAGGLLTPPLTSGCLPGCLRAQLLAGARCTEAVITQDDLKKASRILLGNSLRGLVPAVPLETGLRQN